MNQGGGSRGKRIPLGLHGGFCRSGMRRRLFSFPVVTWVAASRIDRTAVAPHAGDGASPVSTGKQMPFKSLRILTPVSVESPTLLVLRAGFHLSDRLYRLPSRLRG